MERNNRIILTRAWTLGRFVKWQCDIVLSNPLLATKPWLLEINKICMGLELRSCNWCILCLKPASFLNCFDASTVIDSYVPLKAHSLVKMILNHNKRDREKERDRERKSVCELVEYTLVHAYVPFYQLAK